MHWLFLFVLAFWPGELAAAETALPPMPTLSTVGPDAMPAEIAPVAAPFEMPQPSRPKFAKLKLSIKQRGAQRDRQQLSTEAIQHCIDEVSALGGGTVNIPAGKWRTGRILLKSGVNLHLDEGAELHFSGAIEDYLPAVRYRYESTDVMGLGGLIYAYRQSNIAVTGNGILIGPESGPLREIRRGLTDDLINHDLPVEERIFDGQAGRHYFRPYFICPVACSNVLVEGVSLRNGPMWNVVPTCCENVIIRGITIESMGVGNGDGVNIESSKNVLVEYCSVRTGDDCFTLKAGRGEDGVRIGEPVENVILRFNHANGGFGGITCGSDTAGIIRNIYAHDCVFNDVRHAAYFKTRRPRGGGGENILIERIVFKSYEHAIFFDMLGLPKYVGALANRLPHLPLTKLTPYYRKITLKRIHGNSEDEAFKIKGIPESPAAEITLDRIDISSRKLIHLTDAKNVRISNSRFHSKEGLILLNDADDVRFSNVEFETENEAVRLDFSGPNTRSVVFEACRPELEDYPGSAE